MDKIELFIPRCEDIRDKAELESYGALVLAAVGDGVHTLFLRGILSTVQNVHAEDLHLTVSAYARAEAQAEAYKKILPHLSPEEVRISHRGKNARFHTVPKHASKYDYSLASAFEVLTGYLYLSGAHERLCALYYIVYGDVFPEMDK